MSGSNGYVCKSCGNASPIGVGFIDTTPGAAERSVAVFVCDCGKSKAEPTDAAAKRWLAAHVGQEIETVQVKPSGIRWEPGARTLARDGNVFRLDGSRVSVGGRYHVPLSIDNSSITLEWQDDDGVTLATTVYAAVVARSEPPVYGYISPTPGKACKACARVGRLTWLNDDGSCRRQQSH